MESRNPVFNSSKEFQRGGYATFRTETPSAADLDNMYAAPSATAAQMGRMTLDDVVVRTASLFYGNDLVPQAILGTLGAFAAMLVLYRIGAVRNSPKFTRGLMIAAVGYLVFGLLNILLSAFHVGGYQSVYSGGGLLAIAVSGFGVVLASLFLVLDFDFIEQGIRNGLPRQYAWTAAFGLIVTLVWLYLEILLFLAILRG